MKFKNTILLIAIMLFTISSANADYRVYSTQSEFEEGKGAICEQATDGCNTYGVENGKVTYGTEMYCVDLVPEWTCTKFKSDVITTRILSVNTSNDMVACTMEYAPVCGVDGKTYSNRCGAEKVAKVEVDYEGQCKLPATGGDRDLHGCIGSAGYSWSISKNKCIRPFEENILSDNDKSFHDTIRERLDSKYVISIDKLIEKYDKLIEKYDSEKQSRINELMVDKIETKISMLLIKYPQDIALPVSINDKYLTYSLLKLELMKK